MLRRKNQTKATEYEYIGDTRRQGWILLAGQVFLFGLCCSNLLVMAGEASLIPWLIPGTAAFGAAAGFCDRVPPDRTRRRGRTALILAAMLLAGGIVLHSSLIMGTEMILNHLYALGEEAQAYLYDRFEIPAEEEITSGRSKALAVLWMGLAAGGLTGIPPVRMRQWILAGAVLGVFGCLAYFGLVPMALPMGLLLLAGCIALSGGRLRAVLPLLAVLIVIFGVIMAVDPGENTQVSRADEQLRDRMALSTVRLEGMQAPQQEESQDQQEDEGDSGGEDSQPEDIQKFLHHNIKGILLLILLVACVLFIPAVLRDRLEKRRRKNRAGIDSEDPAEAIRAMFPYAVRWLQAEGMTVGNRTYVSLQPSVNRRFSELYGDRYGQMLQLWREAAYSSHPMDEEGRASMEEFLQETIRMVNGRAGWRDRMRFKYVLAL